MNVNGAADGIIVLGSFWGAGYTCLLLLITEIWGLLVTASKAD